MFVTAMTKQWITKVNKPGSIRKETDNNPGYGVSVDQLHSYLQDWLLKYGMPHLELKLKYTMETMEYLLNNFSDQQLRMPARL